MITLKYCKKDALVYTSHIDLLRQVERVLRRADIPVKYSQGYNPHMLINLGITLPLGIGSTAEYVTVDADCAPRDFLERYNRACPAGLVGVAAWRVDKNPNLAGTVAAADYHFAAALGDKAAAVRAIAARGSYVIDYPSKKDPEGQKDVAALLYALEADATGMDVRMAAGNITVRPQNLADAIAKEFGVDFAIGGICRTAQYVRDQQGNLVDVDEMLSGIAGDKLYV